MNSRSRLWMTLVATTIGMAALSVFSAVSAQQSNFLFVWAWDSDEMDSDFLAVVDADPRSESYGTILSTTATGLAGWAHHTNHFMPEGGELLANSFRAGQTFRFDLSDPTAPRIAGSFGNAGPYTYPHSFIRLPNGNILATFHNKGEGNQEAGGLVELDPQGNMLRGSDAGAQDVDPYIRVYSLEMLPDLDRVVTTTAKMGGGSLGKSVQIWRFSDLSLLKTLLLSPGPRGDENFATAEARVLADGRSVYVSTFRCGLYLLSGVDTEEPTIELVRTFPDPGAGQNCALPVRIDDYWIQTVTSTESLVVLDISEPRQPRQIDELRLGDDYRPHWISASPDGRRIVITGYGALRHRVVIADFDRETGKLTLDDRFQVVGQELPGISFDRDQWPHGATGPAVPHGAVFSRD